MFGRRRGKRLAKRVHVRGREAAAKLRRVEHELERARAAFTYENELVFTDLDAHRKHIRRARELLQEVVGEAHEILDYALQLKHELIKQRVGNYVEHEVLTGVERSVEGNARALEERAKRLQNNLKELLLTNIRNGTLRDGGHYCRNFDGLLFEASGIAGIVHQLEEQEATLRE